MPNVSPEPEPDIPDSVIREACAGDQDAFGILFRGFYARVHRTVWGMMGSESEAHDVAQDAWLKAWEKRDRFNFQSRYSTWIHRIAVNTALDALRKRKSWRSRFVGMAQGTRDGGQGSIENLSSDPGPSYGDSSPSSDLQNKELARQIESAVAELPEDQRTVLVLREYEHYSYEEIAKALGIKQGTVMSRLYHARKKLQSILSKELS